MNGGDKDGVPQTPALLPGSPAREASQSHAARLCREAAADWVPYVMLCRDPYIAGEGQAFGCGQCLPCRINRKRVWTHRIMLEAGLYEDNAFVTLTYSEEEEPESRTLVPKHAQDFLKRIRRKIEPNKLRYFIVGEYGDETERPHYHAALFGFPTCIYGSSQYSKLRSRCCGPCDLVRSVWGMGHSYLGTLEPHSAAYISGYVTKKMTAKDDERLDGRYPEFARMSLKPGIGADAMWEIASSILEHYPDLIDVPNGLRHGKTVRPLGRYLVRKLRAYTGRPENAPEEVLNLKKEELQALQDIASQVTSAPGMARFRRLTLKNLIQRRYDGKRAQFIGKHQLFKKRGSQ